MEDNVVRSASDLDTGLRTALEGLSGAEGRGDGRVGRDLSRQPGLMFSIGVVTSEPVSGDKDLTGVAGVGLAGLLELRLVDIVLLCFLVDGSLKVVDLDVVVEVEGLELGKVLGGNADIDVAANDLVVGEVIELEGLLVGGQGIELGLVLDVDADDTVAIVLDGADSRSSRDGDGRGREQDRESNDGREGDLGEGKTHGGGNCCESKRRRERSKREDVLVRERVEERLFAESVHPFYTFTKFDCFIHCNKKNLFLSLYSNSILSMISPYSLTIASQTPSMKCERNRMDARVLLCLVVVVLPL